ncbi:Endonuclease/Exonuclease/phosphatase family protein [Stieleria neptunia]|uniref:Endonuclease/Exonuclease/phosphatase family protein n=1 Tax=Stieleria neptunia TaxID=2527979 RepID=A0A518HHM7_9BACT|nr:endonuclease/exonuclease/phosphatase family protein [Stieleria neptunia]QDV40344.1 Endonuclease/Exonuclease/phosphatase family protein [Stieleria neptunia]
MLSVFNAVIYLLFGILVVGSLLPLSSHPHWFIRGWDFPRMQILVITWLAAAALIATHVIAGQASTIRMAVVATVTLALSAWHLFRIIPYTPLASPQTKAWRPEPSSDPNQDARRLRVLVTNVEEENDQFARWREVILDQDADVIIMAEVDQRWAETIDELKPIYPNQIVYPQNNWYGMALLSRLPILESEIRFRVQDDVPSIDTVVELPSGDDVRIVGVHPRPPEPIRDNHATARDAELVLWGNELADDDRPIIIGGDLNDVAWSQSTRLFLRLSRLLDPRRGRGFFNSFHADRIWMRFPLDHVFHSTHFAFRDMRRLSHVGSDHFPILIDLQLDPQMHHQHDRLRKKVGDEAEAEERLLRAEQAESLDVETLAPQP